MKNLRSKLKQWVQGATTVKPIRSRVDTPSLMEQRQLDKQQSRDNDKFMGNIYQRVKTHRNGEAINLLLTRYDASTPVAELEELYKRVEEWGPSRTLMCLGRLIIHCLDKEKRYGRVMVFIEKCQAISPQFVLTDLTKTLFYVRFAIETGKLEVAKNMLVDSEERYGELVNQKQCREFFQQIFKNEIDIIL